MLFDLHKFTNISVHQTRKIFVGTIAENVGNEYKGTVLCYGEIPPFSREVSALTVLHT